jgi:hypothetical protein
MDQTTKVKFFDRVGSLIRELSVRWGISSNEEESHEELRHRLQRLVDTFDNDSWMHFVHAVYDDFVVYIARGSNPNESGGASEKFYSLNYTVDDEGTPSFVGEPVEVREERTFVPVTASNTKTTNTTAHSEEDRIMEKNELITALIACKRTRFGEDNRTWLETLEVDTLKLLQVEDPPTEPTTPPTEPTTPPTEPTTPPTEPTTPPTEPSGNSATEPVTLESYVAAAPPEVQEVLNRAVARDRAAKDTVVTALTANKRCRFTEEQLRAMSIDDLETLADLANVEVNYDGQTGPPLTDNDPDVPEPIPVFDLSREARLAANASK